MLMSFKPGDEWGDCRIHLLHTPRRTQRNTPHKWNDRSSGQQGAAEESLSSSLSLTTCCSLGDGTQSTPTYVSPGLEGETEVIAKCSAILQEFRDKKITKVATCTKIMQSIPTAFVEGGAGERAVQSYIEILDQTKKELTEAAKHGSGGGGAGGVRPSRSPSLHGGDGGRRPSCSPSPDERRRGKSPQGGDDSGSKLHHRAYSLAWVNSTFYISFPESGWSAIIKGQAVDLNKVISSQFSVSHEWRHVESIDDGVQLLFGSSTTTKTISTHSEWITAWTKAADTTVFVFPHCRHELDSCGEGIHDQIILLNRRLHNEAAGRRDLEFSSCSQFDQWEHLYLNNNSAAFLESKQKAKGLSG
ncbi:hypothetical protein B0H17DRAFT_1124822 [Mycena rosella]|uniref:Uncharacterized protein n=1 Tax=Mycena rosella TaxID=1033263 RepID=A0AAD7MBP9_MYCRO|nr:hypothetical protein B0H17DRAFT_1124822 [Mycena rosella]